jgi:arginine deiminase
VILPEGLAVPGARRWGLGGIVRYGIGADSEIGRLRTVLVHRPGPELKRITPRTQDRLKFSGMPWLSRAQQEHDTLTDVLREAGAEVLYVTELLQDVLEYQAARTEAIDSVLACNDLGDDLGARVRGLLESLPPEDLAGTLIAGLTSDEMRAGHGLVYELLDPRDFVVEPLPNMVFTRDSSLLIGGQAVITGLPSPRCRETELMAVIYGHHPRFAGHRPWSHSGRGQLSGGDVLLLGPGVVAVGVGAGSSAASAERLARHLLAADAAHTVLVVPLSQRGYCSHLDQLCTVVGAGTVVMTPAVAFTLTALAITVHWGELRVSRPRPFLEAAARAVGVDALTVIDTGLDGQPGSAGQWDDGGNALAIGPATTVCSERSTETNARLQAAGFEVITVPVGELGGGRGGPRCLCSALHRDPADARVDERTAAQEALEIVAPRQELGEARAMPEPAGQSAGSEAAEQPRVGELTPMR